MKVINFLRKNWLLLLIILIGAFFRLYKSAEFFNYNHDQDLAGWIIKDILINKHIRLAGQMTSTMGVLIGPLFYYLLVPFYAAFNLDPIGGVYLVAFLGVFAIWSCYFVFSEIFDKKVGIISSIIYAVSPYIVFNDREVVPTMPIMLWSIWFLYATYLLSVGKHKNGLIISAVLISVVWHINLGLLILSPLLLFAVFISKKKLNLRLIALPLILFFVLSTPLIIFEARHGFSEIKSVLLSVSQDQGDILKGWSKVSKIFNIVAKNVSGIIWGEPSKIPISLAFWLVSALSIVLVFKKKIKSETFFLMFIWFLITTAFFSIYSKPVSEYYLNSLTILWVCIISVALSELIKIKNTRYFGVLLLLVFVSYSLYRFLNFADNKQGYIQRKQVVKYIKNDSELHGYPCVAVSYITKPGYNLGYRYFFWLEGLKTKAPSEKIPVYSIVFPLGIVSDVDITFGSIGVINPNYSRYNKLEVENFCQGDNANLIDPMFGYTQ